MGLFDSFSEKELETMIMDNVNIMPDRGLPEFYSNTERQVKIPLSGIADIITWEFIDNILYARIIELKRDEISVTTLIQALDYHLCVGFMGLLCEKVQLEIVLIGRLIKEDIKQLLGLGIPNLKLYRYDFNFNGLYFTRCEEEQIFKANDDELKIQLGGSYEQFISFYKKLLTPSTRINNLTI